MLGAFGCVCLVRERPCLRRPRQCSWFAAKDVSGSWTDGDGQGPIGGLFQGSNWWSRQGGRPFEHLSFEDPRAVNRHQTKLSQHVNLCSLHGFKWICSVSHVSQWKHVKTFHSIPSIPSVPSIPSIHLRSVEVASWLLSVIKLEKCCVLPIIAEDCASKLHQASTSKDSSSCQFVVCLVDGESWWIMVNHGESYSFIQFRFFRMASASQAKLSMMTWWPINNCQSWTWIPMCTSWKQFLRRAVWTSFESFSNWKSSNYHPDQVQQSARFERNDTKCLRDPETELLKNIYFNDIEPVEGCRGCFWHRRLQSFSRRRTILLHRRIWICDPSRSIVCTDSWNFTVPFQVVWSAATETQVYFGISQTF